MKKYEIRQFLQCPDSDRIRTEDGISHTILNTSVFKNIKLIKLNFFYFERWLISAGNLNEFIKRYFWTKKPFVF